jgi:hypothetical protein
MSAGDASRHTGGNTPLKPSLTTKHSTRRLALCLCTLASGVAFAQDAAPLPDWQLWLFHPFRPGVLQQCQDAHLMPNFERVARPDPADPNKAWELTEAFSVTWHRGKFSKPAKAQAADALRPKFPQYLGGCFAIIVNGQPVMSGAAVPAFSARLLEFTTLVLNEDIAPGKPLSFNLLTRFPGQLSQPVPQTWHLVLPKD